MDNKVEKDRRRDGSISSSTTWRSCDSRRWAQRILLNVEGEPAWLTPHQRDLQTEGDRRDDDDDDVNDEVNLKVLAVCVRCEGPR